MKSSLQKSNQISLCYKNDCLNTYGKNADMVAKGATIILLFIGIAALIRVA